MGPPAGRARGLPLSRVLRVALQEMRLQEEEESFSRIAMLKNIEVGRQRQMRHPLVPTLVLSTREMATGDHMDTFNHLRTFLVGKLVSSGQLIGHAGREQWAVARQEGKRCMAHATEHAMRAPLL